MKFKQDLSTLLISDKRFTKCGVSLASTYRTLSELFGDDDIIAILSKSRKSVKTAARLINLLRYADKQNDSFANQTFSKEYLTEILESGEVNSAYDDILDKDLEYDLSSNYLDFKEFESYFDSEESSEIPSKASMFLHRSLDQNEKSVEDDSYIEVDISTEFDESYLIQSVSLNLPTVANVNSQDVKLDFVFNDVNYRLYGESRLPEDQSQITCFTDVNRFSDSDILNLFPPIRLYTRSPYMYQKYEGLKYDDDLGVIFPIAGYSEKRIRKNIIEYPHLENVERIVKIKGKDTVIPFWKYIEVNREIVPTISIWNEFADTLKLPKTESFMNEYVVRKYLLDLEYGKVKPKYDIRGSFDSFLTLYAPPAYYRAHGYDPIEVGRKCIESRKSYKYSRNPVVRMYNILNDCGSIEDD